MSDSCQTPPLNANHSTSINAFATYSKFIVQAKILNKILYGYTAKRLIVFQLRLLELLYTSFPEKAYAKKFVD
ncbi:hypothetical protein ACTFAO_18285 [Sphingobacterium spiritivorum]|uniref:hypothetical protein n=1 Tax=Sphingobacterium spiritivorum TaxID=258 RepID=UPI003F770AD4